MVCVTIKDGVAIAELSPHRFYDAVRQYLKQRYELHIDAVESAEIVRCIGSAYPLSCELAMVFRGVLLTSEEVRDVLRPVLGGIVESLRAVPKGCSIRLAGEDVALRGLNLLIAEETGRYIQ